MLKSIFKKDINNTTYLQELLQDTPNEVWLQKNIKNEMIDLNHQDENGDTFLIKCIKVSKIHSAKWLIQNLVDLTIENNNGKTALLYAIEKENHDVVKHILKHNTLDLDYRDIEGRTILQDIVMHGHNKMAKVLINHGANINNVDNKHRNVLYDALSYGDKSFIQYLLNLEKLDLNLIDDDGNSIMHHIELYKDQEIAQQLLLAGGDINAIGENKESLLFRAVREFNHDAVLFLLEHGINPNIINDDGDTALNLIIYEGTKEFDIIILLIQYGANPNIRNKKGQSIYEILNIFALHLFGTKYITDTTIIKKLNPDGEYITLIEEFLRYKDEDESLNYLDSTGNPLFFDPLLYGHISLFNIYINYGLNIKEQNKFGSTILHKVITANSNEKLINLLLERINSTAPECINITDNNHILPITYAALLGNQKIVTTLLNYDSKMGGKKELDKQVIKKFTPMLKNLKNLKDGIKEPDLEKRFDTLIIQIIRDFKLI